MATREEEHTTRGRARTLFEMLHHPGPIENSWRSEAVREALDLCLACKGCKHDCPVNVDMATYKAEFMAHHYKRRLRPRTFYSMGLIYWWSRLASTAPALVNTATHAPGLGRALKAAGGIAQERRLPPYARTTFKGWFAKRGARNQDKPPVVLFPDTFTNHFHPEAGAAAVEALEAAGYQVRVPQKSLCCGRPLYDKGFLNLAKGLLRQLMSTLGPEVERGVPIVGLEPACVAAFRDELVNMFPDDERAQQLSRRTYILSEFLHQDPNYAPPRLDRKAVVHFHCNHHAILGKQPEIDLLRAMGLDVDVLDSGCCGMAGSFGFEKEHYDVSMRCGERVLLPAVRGAERDALIVSDGFSCREQIAQTTDRRALHVSQVLQMALREGQSGPTTGAYPERGYQRLPAAS
jgi:Fe-S oxidoreductase